MKFITLLAAFLLFAFVAGDNFKCTSGDPYKENNCNSCICDNNDLVCTRKGCPDRQKYVNQCKKTPGKKWKVGCNECVCSSTYGQVCTKKKC